MRRFVGGPLTMLIAVPLAPRRISATLTPWAVESPCLSAATVHVTHHGATGECSTEGADNVFVIHADQAAVRAVGLVRHRHRTGQ